MVSEKTKSSFFRALAVCLVAVVLLGLLELAARNSDPYLRRLRGMKNPFWQVHPTRGYSMKPGDYGSIWGIPFHINKLGFRSPEISREKPAGAFRVFCMGDSITMGPALPSSALYPEVLQGMLGQKYPGKTFEVINAGASGYGIKEELLLLEEDGLALSPDLVVLQYTLYDIPGTSFYDHINPHRDIPVPGKKFLINHFAIARFVLERYDRLGLKNNLFGLADRLDMPPDSDAAQRIEQGWRQYFKQLSDMAELCRKNHIAFLVLIVPHRAQFEDRRQSFVPQKRLLAFCKENNIAAIDPVPIFRSQKRYPFLFDPVHPSMEGHKIIAEVIADWIGKNLNPAQNP
jgi:lysophospholipase L1-like esterase